MAVGNEINATGTGLIKYDGAGTFSAVTTTQYNTLVGAASNGITNISPGTSGQALTSNGASANPSYQTVSGGTGTIIQQVRSTSTTQSSTSTRIPLDNGIPVITEGVEYLTASITPTNSSNKLIIEFKCFCGGSKTMTPVCALFQDSTTNAIDASACSTFSGAYTQLMEVRHIMTAGTTSSTTFRIRFGPDTTTATSYINRRDASAVYGAVPQATLIVTEVEV